MRTVPLSFTFAIASMTLAYAQVYPGWKIIPVAGDAQAIETGLKCIDGECAADTLQCVVFRRIPEKMPEGTRTEALLSANFTWGQFEFWLARRYLDERHDQPVGLDTISNSRRVELPTLKESMGRSYVAIAYATTVAGQEAALPVALWVKDQEIRGLRCSYRVVEGDDPRAKIEQLLEFVIAH